MDKQSICLRKEHPYFSQVQGQLGVGQQLCCDFVVHTTKETEVQRIKNVLGSGVITQVAGILYEQSCTRNS